MARGFEDRPARLDALLRSSEVALGGAFLLAVRRARRSLTVSEIRRRLGRGGTRAVVRLYEEHLVTLLLEHQARAVSAGGSTALEIGRQLGIPRGLDLASLRLARNLSQERDRVLTGILDSQFRSAEAAYGEALRRGRDPAIAVRDSIGLTPVQVAALFRYQDLLAATAREAARRQVPEELAEELREDFADGRPPEEGTAARMVTAYRNNALVAGAALLGLDLAQASLNMGVEEAVRQAEDDVLLERIEWEWLTARDERVRPSHRAMQGQRRPDGEPFRSGDGIALRYPGDPLAPRQETARCRCQRRARAGAVESSEVA